VIEAANRHVVERTFSFDIPRDSSGVDDASRAGSAIDFCQSVIHIAVSYSALPVFGNSAAAAGAAQNVIATAIEANIDFIAVLLS
jgi:hypothetical protein